MPEAAVYLLRSGAALALFYGFYWLVLRRETFFALNRAYLLGAAGLAAPGTLYAAMTSQARARQTLLPLLLFPLVVPVLLAAVKATSLLILGDPMEQARSWTLLLVAFDAIHWSLCGLLFSRVVED